MTQRYQCLNYHSLSDPQRCSFTGSYTEWEEFAALSGLTVPPSSSLENANYGQLRDAFVSSRNSWAVLASSDSFNLQVSTDIVLQGVLRVYIEGFAII